MPMKWLELLRVIVVPILITVLSAVLLNFRYPDFFTDVKDILGFVNFGVASLLIAMISDVIFDRLEDHGSSEPEQLTDFGEIHALY